MELIWYRCPICKQKLLRIDPKQHIMGVFIKCKKCRNEVQIINEPKPEPTASAV